MICSSPLRLHRGTDNFELQFHPASLDAGFLLFGSRRAIMVSIIVNGRVQQVDPGITVAELLEILKMNPKFLAVELNRKVIPRAEHRLTTLAPDDQLEIVTLVGGG